MNELKPTYTQRTADAIEAIGARCLSEAGRKKYVFSVDCLTGDVELTELETGECVTRAQEYMGFENVLAVGQIVESHIRDMVMELAIKGALECTQQK